MYNLYFHKIYAFVLSPQHNPLPTSHRCVHDVRDVDEHLVSDADGSGPQPSPPQPAQSQIPAALAQEVRLQLPGSTPLHVLQGGDEQREPEGQLLPEVSGVRGGEALEAQGGAGTVQDGEHWWNR